MPDINLIDGAELDFCNEVEMNEPLIHQAVVAYEANKRADVASVKNRKRVAGRNKKPWRQKGTGRARHGSRISPLWVGGGRAHGPSGQQDHSQKLTRKMKQKALLSALAVRAREDSFYRLTEVELDEPNTATMHNLFEEADLDDESVLLITDGEDRLLSLSVRNLPYCRQKNVDLLTTYHVVANSVLVFAGETLEQLKARFE